MATLQDIVDQLKAGQQVDEQLSQEIAANAKSIDKLATAVRKTVDAFTQAKKNDRLDQLERDREARNPPKSTLGQNFQAGQQAGAGFGLGGILQLLDFSKWLLPALMALPAAIAGMRGWEIPVVSKLMRKLGDALSARFTSLASGIDDITRTLLKRFGIDPTTGRMLRDAKGRFTGKELKSTATMISEAFDSLSTNILKSVGLDDSTKIGKTVRSVGGALSKIFGPLVSMGTAVGGWMAGAGAKLLGFLDGVMGISATGANIGKFASFAGKILKPLGFLFSAYEGVMAFMNTEGTIFDKFVAGIGAFIGDFVGAPLDLLKSIVSWALGKLGFENAATFLESFSFETIINDLIGGIGAMVTKAVDWVKLLFTDPGQALSDLFWGYVGAYETVAGWLYDLTIRPLVDWFTNTFPDLSAAISAMWEEALGGAKDLGEWLWNNSIGPLWDWITNTFSWDNIKKTLGLSAEGGPTTPEQYTEDYGYQDPSGAVTGHADGGKIPYGKWGVVGERGPELIPGPATVVPISKGTGRTLALENANLAASQKSSSGGLMMANSNNNVNTTTNQSVINYGIGNLPSAYDVGTPSPYRVGYGIR